MKKKCVVLDDYQGVALEYADWTTLSDRVDVTVLTDHITDQDRLVALLADAEILVIMRERTPLPASLLARLPQLRLIITSGMRNSSIDLAAAAACGIAVCGTGSDSAPPLELTWALLLALARHLPAETAALRAAGPWQSTVGADLRERRLGILGLGKIGSRVAQVAQAFGMRVSAWSPNLTAERAAAAGAELAPSKSALFAHSDFVTLHLVLSERSRGIVGPAELAQMPSHAFLINTSRSGLVDQNALVAALQAGRIAGAGLDVFDEEPLPPDHPWRRLPNVLATPHLGYVTQRNYQIYFSEAVEDIEAWLVGNPLRVLGV